MVSVPLKRCRLFLLSLVGLLWAIVPSGFGQLINANFDALPDGSQVFGNASVSGGILHLTDNANSQSGAWLSPTVPGRIASYTITFKALVGGGTCCGDPTTGNPNSTADGFSVNVANDLPAGTYAIAEEGAGTGLSVCFDTWDNGGGEAPAIDIKWKGATIRSVRTQVAQSPDMANVTFKNVSISVTDFGLVTVKYDGTNVMTDVPLPGYAPTAGLALGMGGRTGGANENHWIDDLRVDATLAELSTTRLVAPEGSTWKYDDTTSTPGYNGTGWELPGYNDAGWKTGTSLFGNDGAGIYDAPGQPFVGRGVNGFETVLDRSNGRITFYFRKKFNWSGPTAGVTLVSSNWIDDGIVAYLNGAEVSRIRIADGPVTWDTLGANPPTEGVVEVRTWSAASLVQGENTIAVELHQSSATSSDAAMAMSLDAVAPLRPIILNPADPTNRVIFANRSTTLSISAIGSPTPTYQWYKDGNPIAGATESSYVIPQMAASDAGAYFVRISNAVGTIDSRTATVGYDNDVTAPNIVEVVGSSTFDKITVVFNELVERNSAQDAFAYSLADSGGNSLNIISAELSADGKSVVLTTDPQTPDTLYTVTVANIADAAGNVLASGSAQFRSWVPGPCNGVLFETFDTPGRSTIDNLINSQPNYPNNPRERFLISGFDSRLAYPDDAHEDYAGRLRGLFIPPVSGNWIFHMRSDDPGRLFFNPTGPSAAGKIVVGNQPGCCNVFPASGAQLSAPFALEAGKGYYVEMVYWEYGGGDYGQVAVQLQGTPAPTAPTLIGSLVGAGAAPAGVGGPLNITAQPANQSVLANAIVTFSIGANNPNGLPICYQWRRNGTDIPGANGPSYTFGPVSVAADNGATFDVVASIIGATVTSSTATLTVAEDVSKPTVVSVKGSTDLSKIVVVFSEFLDPTSAGDEFNYALVSGPATLDASVGADGKTVSIKLDAPLALDTQYTLSISGVKDLSLNEMVAVQVPFKSFARVPGFVLDQIYLGLSTSSVDINDLRNSPKYPSFPDIERYKGLFELNTFDEFEGYGARMSGWLTAPVSGAYTFYMSSDDHGEFYLSTDQSPANLQLVASEPVWNGRRDWLGTARRDATNPENRSTKLFPNGIQLVAGQSYYFEALVKEGGGGDNLAVTWRLPGAPEPISGSTPISGIYMSSIADPSGASLAITQQPTDQTFVISSDRLLNEAFTSNNGGFTVDTPAGESFSTPWTYDSAAGTWQVTQQNEEINHPMTTRLVTPELTVTKAGTVTMSFDHRYSFESGGGLWDGGAVQISVNGGAYANVPGSAFTQNGYNGTVIAGSRSVLVGQAAFTADSAGHSSGQFPTSIATLGSFNPGDKIRIRFLYAGDTNTRGPLTPSWEITRVEVNQGGGAVQSVTFSVAINASKAGETTPTTFYQWMRDNGSGFFPIAGANGPSLTFTPLLADNGAKFKAEVYIIGAHQTSDTATLHVITPNTPPRFTGGPNQVVNEDAPAQSVPNWATGITVHSYSRDPIAYANDFSTGPNGMTLGGIATIADGVLKLTTPTNSSYGAAAISAPIQTYESLNVTWKSRVGGGQSGGADGYSLNIGADVPADPGYGGEEGIGTGLTVTVDTFDNGTGLDVGVDIKWKGSRVAYVGIPKDDDGSGNFLRKDTFVNASLSLSAAGVATCTYDGNTISATIPDYAGLRADRALFWARTGGANDNHWVDDFSFTGFTFDASSSENGQTVQFIVTNDNPSLFSVQPAVSPTGTLTYTPAPNANGLANVTVVAKDSGGTAAGGNDTSAAFTFTIRVNPVNDCPTLAAVPPINVASGGSASGQLVGSDIDTGDTLSYNVTAPPVHGTVVLQLATGAFTYTPIAGYSGPDSFSATVRDAANCASSPVVVSISVGSANRCPTAIAKVQPNIQLTPGQTETVVISSNGTNGCLALDGTMSSDPDGDALTFSWVVVLGNGSTVPLASGASATACLDVGTYTVRLVVDDGHCTRSADVQVEIITAGEAIDTLIDKVNGGTITRKTKQPFIASLKAAVASFDRGSCNSGVGQLHAFVNKVRAQLGRTNPDVATELTTLANAILAQIDCPEQ